MKKYTHPKVLRPIAGTLLVIGGCNRGLIGLFNFNIIEWIFGYGFFTHVIYIIIGISTIYVLLYPRKVSHILLKK